MNFSAVILAGGKSSRMNRDKALLEIGGQTLLARQIELAQKIGAKEIFISSGAEKKYAEFNRRILTDTFSDAGPLAGIERALGAISTSLLLALAVDLPNLNPDLIQKLLRRCAENSGAIPRVNGEIEPLAAIYTKAAHSLSVKLLKERFNAAQNFAIRCVESGLATLVDLPASDKNLFTNWNSPSDI